MGSESKRRTRLVVLDDDGIVGRAVGVGVGERNIQQTVGERMMMTMMMTMMALTDAEA